MKAETRIKMDSFEDIAVILFLLISFISSLLSSKKKKKAKLEEAKRKARQNFEQPPKEAAQKDVFDPFTFIAKETQKKVSEVDAYFEQLEKETKTPFQSVKREIVKPVLTYQQKVDAKKRELRGDKDIAFSEIAVSQKRKKVNKQLRSIKSKIRSPKTAKELILFQEILNKPKALSNNG